MAILEHINDPSQIRNLNAEDLRTLCAELRQYIIECCAENPGHIGASLGAVEIAVALHKVFNTPEDQIIWDVGHQAYAHKILTGRREAFKQNRKKDGISGFPRRDESPYDAFGTGHSSTSISAALGLAVAAQMQGRSTHAVAVIGDGALTGGLAFEGINNAGSLKTDLLVILNDNQISIDQNTGALHNYLLKVVTSRKYNILKKSVWDRLGASRMRNAIQKSVKNAKRFIGKGADDRYSLFDSLGFRYFGPIDGNDVELLTETLERLKTIPGPKLLHVITVKGKGFRPAEENQTIWHAPGTFDPKTGVRTGKKPETARFQEVFGTTLLELARTNDKIVGITPAMATGCSMDMMMAAMPERVFDVGIAEQHAVTFSAGLAANGLLPVCNIYSSFSQRAFDGLVHDVALQKLKVILCLDRAGLVGEDGATHHGAFDMASYRAIPNLTIMSPLNERELRNMLYSATLHQYGATVIRYPRGCGSGAKWREMPFEAVEPGKAVLLSDCEGAEEGKCVAVLSIGPIGTKAAEAVAQAAGKGVRTIHYDMRFLKPLDTEAVAYACSKAGKVITVEDGAVKGGLHSAVAEYIAENGLKCRLVGLGIPDAFIEQGKPEELYSECRFNTSDILNELLK